MKETKYMCDRCGIDLSLDTSHGYVNISHCAIPKHGIWGDNRIPNEGIDLCKGCFNNLYQYIKNEN